MISLKNIKTDLIQALKTKETLKAEVLRMLVSAIKNKQINDKKEELKEEEILALVKSEAKKRKDSIKAYEEGGRDDLATQEKEELQILNAYLPAQLSEEEIRSKIQEIKNQSGLDQFGPLMGKVMAALGQQADGQVVQKILKEELEK